MTKIKKYVSISAMLLILGGFVSVTPALADSKVPEKTPATWSGNKTSGMRGGPGEGMMKPAVFGKVSAISGNTITVNAEQGLGLGRDRNDDKKATTTKSTKVFTIDASSATVFKNNSTSTVSSISIGDTLLVQGVITGTTIKASVIRDGIAQGPGMMGKNDDNKNSQIQGNGQPVVAGKIATISGSTMTITNNSNITYTIDTNNAKIVQGKDIATQGTLKVGDSVVVQGTINGTSVVASTIIDQSVKPGSSSDKNPSRPGFFAGIGQFFGHLFGF